MLNNENLILNKLKNKELAPFTIFEPTPYAVETNQFVTKLSEILHKHFQNLNIKTTNPLQHEDVLFITHKEDSKSETIKVSDLDELFQFIETLPLRLPQKIVIFDDIQKMSDVLLNKCLKFFEEPPSFVIIILLNPSQKKIMPTIHSRAKHLYLEMPAKENLVINDVLKFMQSKPSFFQFADEFKKQSWLEQDLLDSLMALSVKLNNYKMADSILKMWKFWLESVTFNQSEHVRLHLFYQEFIRYCH
jgi:hypothetical protein